MTPLLIGYNASSSLGRRTGIGRATLELLRAMVRLSSEDGGGEQFRVFVTSLLRRRGPEHRFLSEPPVHLSRRFLPGASLVRDWAEGRGRKVEDLVGPVDLFHAPDSYLPPSSQARRAVTVHDLSFLESPNEDETGLAGELFTRLFPQQLPAADLVLTPSRYTREAILNAYPQVREERVHVVPWGIDHSRFYPEAERLVEIARASYGIPDGPFLLAVTDKSPRKRNGLLLDTYERLLEEEPATPPLVVLGWEGSPPDELRTRRHLYRRVHVLRRVRDDDLRSLYASAVATLYTSSCEGFGFPILEAMACGSPLLCQRTTSLPETGGEAAVYCDSGDPDEWVQNLRKVAFRQDEHDRWRAKGLEHAKRFNWKESARKTLELYRRAIDA